MSESKAAKSPFLQFIKASAVGFFTRMRTYDNELRAIFILLVLCFANMITSVIGTFVIGIYLLCRKDAAADIFRTGSNKPMFFFLALNAVIAVICRNFLGLLALAFVFAASVCMTYFMQHITRKSFEDMVTIFIGYSIIASLYSIPEYLIGRLADEEYRCSSTFINPLYYSYFIVFALLFCTYRIITVSKYRRIYIPALLLNSLSMILSGGRMPWAGLLSGLFIILLLKREYKLLGIFSAFDAMLGLLMYFFPNINIFAGLRLDKIDVSYDGRKPYWEMAIRGIFDRPVFGHGLLGVLNDSMKSDHKFMEHFAREGFDILFTGKHFGWKMHAHNIILDSLYNYGLVGSLILAGYILKKWLLLFKNCGYATNNPHFALLCGIIVSIAVNGMVDCEIVGLQTSVFSLLAFSMTGFYSGEKSADVLYKLEPSANNDE